MPKKAAMIEVTELRSSVTDELRAVLKDALHFCERPNQKPALEKSTMRIFTANGTAERIRDLLSRMA